MAEESQDGSDVNQVLTEWLAHRIFLTRRLYARENSNSQEYGREHDDPACRHVQQVCGIDQPADHQCESNRVNAE